VQCKGDGAQLAVDAVSVSTAEPVIEVGDMCGDALKALQDAGFVTDVNCGQWSTTPRRGLANAIEPGMWIIGAQITPGTYRAENAIAGCYWQRLNAFTGTLDAIIANQLTSSAGGQLVTIANTDIGFTDFHVGDRVTISGTPKGSKGDVDAVTITRNFQ